MAILFVLRGFGRAFDLTVGHCCKGGVFYIVYAAGVRSWHNMIGTDFEMKIHFSRDEFRWFAEFDNGDAFCLTCVSLFRMPSCVSYWMSARWRGRWRTGC